MKPSSTLATCITPSGASLECIAHDNDIYLYLDRQPICSTRAHEPERALACAGCSRISQYRNPVILLAGLGLGHCLQETLTIAPPKAVIHLVEPVRDLMHWNRTLLGPDAAKALQDSRLVLETKPLAAMLAGKTTKFDAIMISDDPGLQRAASTALRTCARCLNPKGVLCIKATRDDAQRIRGILHTCKLQTAIFPVAARAGGRTRTHAIIAAAARADFLPESIPE